MRVKLVLILLLIVALFFLPGTRAQSGWTASRFPSKGRDLNAVYFIDAKRGWIGGDEGLLTHTEDGGASWIEQRVSTTHAVNDIYFAGKDSGFALAGDTIFSTGDGGYFWQKSHQFQAADFHGAVPELYSLRFNGKKKGWVVGSISRGDTVVGSILAITRDGGSTWHLQDVHTQQELIHIDFVDDKHGWIVGAAGAILHTNDAGETWTPQNSETKVTLFHVDFRTEKQGLAVGERGTILSTNNGGQTWSKIASPARGTLLSVQYVNEDQTWIVGRSGVILRSGNGGDAWVEQESGTKQNLFAMFMSKKDGWAVGSDGLILHYAQ